LQEGKSVVERFEKSVFWINCQGKDVFFASEGRFFMKKGLKSKKTPQM